MSDSIIRLICPNLKCRKILAVPAGTRGKSVRCRNCGMRIRVPMPANKLSKLSDPTDAPTK